MALVSGSIPSLANGISQQPPWARLPSQGEAQENGVSSLVNGLSKRPGSRHLARIRTTPYGSTEPFVHTIDRDETNRYVVLIENGDLRVFDLDGNEKTVSFPNGKGYLTAASPSTSFAALSVADYTFIVNKTTGVTETTPPATLRVNAYIYIKGTGYNVTYQAYVNGTLRATKTTSATSPERTDEDIAESLRSQLAAALTGWTITRVGSVIKIYHPSALVSVGATDSQGNSLTVAYADTIQSFVDLPPNAIDDGQVIEVTGSGGNDFDSYYVKYNGADNIWDEVVWTGANVRPNPATMPYALVRTGSTFSFQQIDWKFRGSGDVTSNPSPSFVGRKITDVFFYRNRLGFLTDENICLSGVGDEGYYNFYRTTMTTLLDTDPIDIAVTNTKVSLLQHAVAFNKQLLLFADGKQFLVDGDGLLSQGTIQAKPTTEFSASLIAKPVNAGKSVLFATLKGTNAGVREFLIQPDSLVEDADDVTKQVPSYIQGEIVSLAAASNDDAVFALASGDRSRLYVYKFFYEGTDKLQSSWSRWNFATGEKVLNISTLDNYLLVVIERSTGVFLELIELDAQAAETGLPFLVRLDRKVSLTGIYNAGTNKTTWTLPYSADDWTPRVVRGSAFGGQSGTLINDVTKVNSTTLEATGDYSAGVCYIGRPYTFQYEFSRLTVSAGSDQRGRTAITDGRLQLRTLTLNYSNTAFMKVRIEPLGRTPKEKVFFPVRVGIAGNPIGQLVLPDGQFRVPILSRNDQVRIIVESDSHLPCSILSAGWEGEFAMRSQRT